MHTLAYTLMHSSLPFKILHFVSFYVAECPPLGMESHKIESDQLSASSVSQYRYSPQRARLNMQVHNNYSVLLSCTYSQAAGSTGKLLHNFILCYSKVYTVYGNKCCLSFSTFVEYSGKEIMGTLSNIYININYILDIITLLLLLFL